MKTTTTSFIPSFSSYFHHIHQNRQVAVTILLFFNQTPTSRDRTVELNTTTPGKTFLRWFFQVLKFYKTSVVDSKIYMAKDFVL